MFLYFLPKPDGRETLHDDDVRAAPCAARVSDTRVNLTTDATPIGAPGWLLGNEVNGGPVVAYRKDQQTWQRIGNIAVGYWNDHKPTPVDLARDNQLPGYETVLGDGNAWRVPLVRLFENGESTSTLPRPMRFDGETWSPSDEPDEAYQHLADICDPFWNAWYNAVAESLEADTDSYRIDVDDPYGRAAAILAVNYHVTPYELSVLGTFTTQTYDSVIPVLEAAVDATAAYAWLHGKKKSADVGTPTDAGEAA